MLTITLNPQTMKPIRERDPRMLSYNIEITELTGGTFWKPYTDAQVDGTEAFVASPVRADMYAPLPQIDLTEPRIIACANALGRGRTIVRFSGSWSTRTYFDWDDSTHGVVPEGFEWVLTRDQLRKALDFVKAIDGEVLLSVANSRGVHANGGTGEWLPDQAEKLWDFVSECGMTVSYAQFMNEPNLMSHMNLPEGYNAETFGRDHDLFARWLREKHPETKFVDPCAADGPMAQGADVDEMMKRGFYPTRELLKCCREPMDVYSFHSYAAMSERAIYGPHFTPDEALDEKVTDSHLAAMKYHAGIRDEFAPGAQLFITETAGACCGGSTWAPTFMEIFRALGQVGIYSREATCVIFHNTLASSAYGLLDPATHLPRPHYWAWYLFNLLAGGTVYDSGIDETGAHVYAFSRADGKEGRCVMVINNSKTETTAVTLPGKAEAYILSSDRLRSRDIFCNGEKLVMVDDHTLPVPQPHMVEGTVELAPATVGFFVM